MEEGKYKKEALARDKRKEWIHVKISSLKHCGASVLPVEKR